MANRYQIQLQDTRTRTLDTDTLRPINSLRFMHANVLLAPNGHGHEHGYGKEHGVFPPATVAIFIDTIGKNVCQVAADRLQMCAKCANDALSPSLSPPLSLPHTLHMCVIYIYEHMNLQLQLVVRSTRLSLKSRPSRWPNCKHSCILANRQPNTNVNTNPSPHSVQFQTQFAFTFAARVCS